MPVHKMGWWMSMVKRYMLMVCLACRAVWDLSVSMSTLPTGPLLTQYWSAMFKVWSGLKF